MPTLLIVEDDKDISHMLSLYLTSQGYQVLTATHGKHVYNHLPNTNLIILDWMLPDTNGLQLLKAIRSNKVYKHLPILMLTARSKEDDKIAGLDTGADDYMTKPVSLKELGSRIKALLRRLELQEKDAQISFGSICINDNQDSVTIQGKQIHLKPKEYQLLRFFMHHPERLHTRAQLLDQIWGLDTYVEERTVDVLIMRLRKILNQHDVANMLQTVYGVGYRFCDME